MGVPTLTLTGETMLARQGASLLTAAGLSDWVASSAEDYVAKVAAFSLDLPRLSALRAGLREQVQTSPLFDAERFARNGLFSGIVGPLLVGGVEICART